VLWNVYGECDNIHVINSAHSGAILDLHFSSAESGGSTLYTASTDKTVGVFDVSTGARIKRLKGHATYVNSVHPARRGEPFIVSGSDDCMIKVWDQRKRSAVQSLNNTYQVTAVTFNDTAENVVSAGIDNQVKIWDLRKPTTPSHVLSGHTDTVTGISLSPDGSYVLTNAMDNTLRVWDIRPFAPEQRCVKIITG
jgi:Prp8 binding protein